VFVPMAGATLIYFGIAFAVRIPFAHDVVSLLRKRVRV
jgi:hypothetical protein